MKNLLTLLFVSLIVLSCSEDNIDAIDKSCSTPATVVDRCGFVFELEDGTRLEPELKFYPAIYPPTAGQLADPLYKFNFVDGKKVLISYVEKDNLVNSCIRGRVVEITCLTELDNQSPGE